MSRIVSLFAFSFLLSACGGGGGVGTVSPRTLGTPSPPPSGPSAPPGNPTPTATSAASATPAHTATPASTATPAPTATPTPKPTPAPTATPPATAGLAAHVLVVANGAVAQSVTLAGSYMTGRAIPASHLVTLAGLSSDPNSYAINAADLKAKIFAPVASAIASLGAGGTRIDFVVMMYATPYLISDGTSSFNGYSVDGVLSQATGAFPTQGPQFNPYYAATAAFSSATYKMVLVTRLDGRSVADVAALIAHGLAADGTRPKGLFFFDRDPNRAASSGYAYWDQELATAGTALSGAGYTAQVENTTAFINPGVPLMGYASWGSNDAHFSSTAYDSLAFVPGAIAETAVSTSASNIRTPGGGQSQIADLIHQGVTGVHGDVTEPYLNAIPDPQYVFPAYVSGRTLAESLYDGLQEVIWKEIVIGDPICVPY